MSLTVALVETAVSRFEHDEDVQLSAAILEAFAAAKLSAHRARRASSECIQASRHVGAMLAHAKERMKGRFGRFCEEYLKGIGRKTISNLISLSKSRVPLNAARSMSEALFLAGATKLDPTELARRHKARRDMIGRNGNPVYFWHMLTREKCWETLLTASDLQRYEYSDLIVLFQELESVVELRERIGQELQHRESAIEA
jgi:hypothetical protein